MPYSQWFFWRLLHHTVNGSYRDKSWFFDHSSLWPFSYGILFPVDWKSKVLPCLAITQLLSSLTHKMWCGRAPSNGACNILQRPWKQHPSIQGRARFCWRPDTKWLLSTGKKLRICDKECPLSSQSNLKCATLLAECCIFIRSCQLLS